MVTTNKQTTNNRVNLEQVRSWTVNRADFCNYFGDKIVTKMVKIPVFHNINHKIRWLLGYWKAGDYFGETSFTEFCENIRDSLHLVTKNVQNFVKNT